MDRQSNVQTNDLDYKLRELVATMRTLPSSSSDSRRASETSSSKCTRSSVMNI